MKLGDYSVLRRFTPKKFETTYEARSPSGEKVFLKLFDPEVLGFRDVEDVVRVVQKYQNARVDGIETVLDVFVHHEQLVIAVVEKCWFAHFAE